jgi:uncharacterized protein YlzI (FlbEa/FlbD family)
MLELTTFDGKPVGINPDNIFYVQASGGSTALYSASGHMVLVRETYEQVKAAMEDWEGG